MPPFPTQFALNNTIGVPGPQGPPGTPGTSRPATKSITASYAVLTTDGGFWVDPTSGAITLTLPASPNLDEHHNFKVLNLTHTVTIAGNGNDVEQEGANGSIPSPASTLSLHAGDSVELNWNGTLWLLT